MSTRIFGSGIRRREDPRLITGTATYTDDLTLPRMVHAAMLRSPHAHARITSIDTSKAAAAAGVVAVYTHADIEGALPTDPLRLAASRFRPEGGHLSLYCEGRSALTWVTSSRWSCPRTGMPPRTRSS